MPGKNNRIDFQVGFSTDKASINSLKKSLQEIGKIKPTDFSGAQKDLRQVQQTAQKVEIALAKAFNVKLGSLNVSTFNKQLKSVGLSVDTIYQDFSKLGAQGQVAFSKMANSVLTTNLQLKQSKSLLTSMGETMMNTVKWGIASSVMNTFTNSVRQAFQYAKSLDGALTDIRIVTGDSVEQMRDFAKQANSAAQNLGRSTMDYTKAALTFYQQGLSDEEVKTRTETVLKAQNITGAGQEMADYLTAVWNGYKVANEEAELYVDKLAAVADSSASNMSELAVAMSKVAATANALGVPVDSLNAQIATITATTRQAPETVGNALKTIYARINDIKTGADDAQVSLGNYSGIMTSLGFNVLDANGALKDTGVTLTQIGEKWGTLSREQQIYLARTMAGQRQYNNLIALFDNWSKYSDLLNVSMEAQGTTMEKNSRYMDSLEAKLEKLGTASQRVKDALIDEEALKGLASVGTGLVNLFANLVQSIGGGGNALLLLGSTLTNLFSGVISKEINSIVVNMQNARDNARKLQEDIKNTQIFGQSQGYQQGVITEMINAKKEIQQYYGIISTQQVNAYNNLVKEVGKTQDEVAILKEKKDLAESYTKALEESVQKINSQKGKNDALTTFEEQLVDAKIRVQEVKQSLQSIKADEIAEELNAVGSSDGLDKLFEQVVELESQVGEAAPQAFDKFYDAVNKMGSPGDVESGQIRAIINAARELREELQTGINASSSLANINREYELAKARAQQASQAAKQYIQTIQQFSNIQGIVQATAAVGRLAGALNSLANLKNIWSNDTLTGGQKILQTMMSLGMAIPMLVSSFQKLKTITASLSASLVTQNSVKTASLALDRATIAAQTAKTAALAAQQKVVKYKTMITKTEAEIQRLRQQIINGDVSLLDKVSQQQLKLTLARKRLAKETEDLAIKEGALKTANENLKASQDKLSFSMASNPIGMWALGIAAAIGVIYGLVKIYDATHMSVKEAEEALTTFNEKLNQTKQNLKKIGSDETKLNVDEWEDLSRKAGAYNSTINNLTEDEKSRYYELSNLIAQYNSDAVIGYDQQGNAIIDVNHKLEQTIQLLKDKRQAEIDSFVNSDDFKKGIQAQETLYKDKKADKDTFDASVQAQQYQMGYQRNLEDLQQSLSAYGQQYYQQIEKLVQFERGGLEYYKQHRQELKNLIEKQIPKQVKINYDYLLPHFDEFDIQKRQKEINEQAKKASKINFTSFLLPLLQSSGNSEEYNKAKQLGGDAINSILKGFVEGLDLESVRAEATQAGVDNVYQYIIDNYLNGQEGILPQLQKVFQTQFSNSKGQKFNLTDYLNNIIGDVDSIDFSSLSEKNKFITEKLAEVFQGIGGFLKDNPQLREAMTGYIGRFFNLDDIDWDALTGSIKISDKKIEGLRDRIVQKVASKLNPEEGFSLPIEKLTAELPADISNSQIDNIITKFDSLYDGTKNWTEVLDQARQSVQAMGSVDTFGNLGKFISGDIKKGSQEYAELESQLKKLADTYPSISNAVKILQQDWMQSTMTYQDALQDINSLLLLTMQKSIQAGDLTTAQVSQKLVTLIQNSETLQDALGKGLIGQTDYYNVLGNLASKYESCTEELNNYAHALQNGTAQTIKSATATLQLSLRSAQLSQATNINANQIERTAAMLAASNPALQQNSELAADAAVRYIKLNTALDDLYTNSDKYTKFLSNVKGQQDIIYANEQLFNSFEQIKQVVSNVFDVDSKALGDDWILNHLEEIIKMSKQGGQGLEQLRRQASQQILVNTGIDMSNFSLSKEEFLNQLAELDQGAQLNLDLTNFIQQLVTAMEQAGYAQGEIEDRLSGLGVDVDLAPMETTLNQAANEAGQFGKTIGERLSDSMAENAGVSSKIVSQTQENPQQTIVPGQDYDVDYAKGEYQYPIFSISPGVVPVINQTLGTFQTRVPIFRPKQLTETVQGSVQTAATALQVIGAHKSSGGKISNYNKPASRAARKPSKGGKSGGGGGSGSPKKATIAKTSNSAAKIKVQDIVKQPDHNPYQQTEKAYQRQSDILDKLQDQQKNLTNKDRLKNLREQNKVLEKQRDILKQELQISDDFGQENTTAYWRKQLEDLYGQGNIGFDEDKQISDKNALEKASAERHNQAAISALNTYQQFEKDYNDWIQNVWNKYSGDQQEQYKAEKEKRDEALKQAEEDYKEALKAADKRYKDEEQARKNYQKAWEEDLKREKQLADLERQIYENHVAEFELRLQLKVDAGDLNRQLNEFNKKVVERIKDDDFAGQTRYLFKDISSYIDSGQLEKRNAQIEKLNRIMDNLKNDGEDEEFGYGEEGIGRVKAELQKLEEEQMKALEELVSLQEEAYDKQLDAIDKANDKINDQIDEYSRINDLIEHNTRLIELIYGDKSYKAMDNYYEMQKANNMRNLQDLVNYRNYWKEMMDKEVAGSEAWQKYKENFESATDQINSKLEEMIENLATQLQARLKNVVDQLNNTITGGRGLDFIDQEWDAIDLYDQHFLDPVESKMGVKELTDLYQQAIDGLDGNPAQQQKMNKLMNDQLKLLREKDKLTQYDIDRAKAALEVEKARIALEEARENKTKMRLRRDSQGNYTYQYVADEEKLTDLQSALSEAEANLYNMDKEHYKQNLNDLYDTYKDYIEKRQELDKAYAAAQAANDEAQAARIKARIKLLDDSYTELYDDLSEEQRYAYDYLTGSTQQVLGVDWSGLSPEEVQKNMKEIVPYVQSSINDLNKYIKGSGGLAEATKESFKVMQQQIDSYAQQVEETLNVVGTNVTDIMNGEDQFLKENLEVANEFLDRNEKIIESCQKEIETVQNLIKAIDDLITHKISLSDFVANINNGYNTLQKENGSKMHAEDIPLADQTVNTTNPNPVKSTSTGTSAIGSGLKNSITAAMATDYNSFLSSNLETNMANVGYSIAQMALNREAQMQTLSQAFSDNQRIINAVNDSIVLDMMKLQQDATLQITGLLQQGLGYLADIATSSRGLLEQSVTITANFPNVASKEDIKQAFDELRRDAAVQLSNVASQSVSSQFGTGRGAGSGKKP